MVIYRKIRENIRKKRCCYGTIAIKKEKCSINLNKTVYIGGSILDLCKVLMQDFQCNYIKNIHSD